jgi:fructokinase
MDAMNRAEVLVGVDLGGTKIEAAIVAAGDGRLLLRERLPTPRGDYAATLEAIAALLRRVDRELPAALRGVAPVGVGMPGSLDPQTGRVRGANSTVLNGQRLGDDLQRRLGRPVRLANDANCLAVSEAVDGAAAGLAGPVFGVILGTGVGGGIACGGRVWSGANGVAGEWGHNPLPWPRADEPWCELPGPRCWCGRHGCIETWLSGPALERRFAEHAAALGVQGSFDAEAIAGLAAESRGEQAGGDGAQLADAARAELDAYVDRLARALAAVVNLLDPAAIVLGGGVSNLSRLYEDVPRRWGAHVFSAAQVATPLLQARHGDSSGVRGAAWLWAEAAERSRAGTV